MGMSKVWKPLSVVSGLLVLLTYLLLQSRSPDLALRARVQETLQTLQLHDTELTRDVLLARAALLPHYDSLPRTGQSLTRTVDTLRAESAADAQHVEQIVVNLLTNALEALPDRKHGVTVTTAFDAAERSVLLEVRDEGVGIPPEHLARVCDPFFTTKHDSGGTGLGLAITSSLVRVHGGRLTFASEPGKGTCVCVTFPCPEEEPPPPGTLPPAREEPSRP
jgi:signal transduction histidine kinase